ncbi:hypothetical protein [Dyadobacter sp. Leaf189]|uniref:hypothetical protein n=1 Tax=Dyadobacter sp. Leaf189 TaxID=1736295 RepID=UPI0012F924E8|nr:hypothetical protein [Dyadobacter sp. Leaf189]
MKKWIAAAGVLFTLAMAACNDDGLDAITTVNSNFETGEEGWVAEFSDYSTKTDTSILKLAAGVTSLPKGLDSSQQAFMIQSTNRSDDVFMYLKKKVTGLVPGKTYETVFDINLGTNAANGSVGIGGSPANSVYVKVGASGTEPRTILKGTEYEFNLDKGQQSQGGADVLVLGDVANGTDQVKYTLIDKSNADKPFIVKANPNGEIWLFVGTDSGYEGTTRLYYNRIIATLQEVKAD